MTTLTHTSEIVDSFGSIAKALVRGLAAALAAGRRPAVEFITPRMARPTLSDRMMLLQPPMALSPQDPTDPRLVGSVSA